MLEKQSKILRNIIIAIMVASVVTAYIRYFGITHYGKIIWVFAFELYLFVLGVLAFTHASRNNNAISKGNIYRKYLIAMALSFVMITGLSMMLSSPLDDVLYSAYFVIILLYFIMIFFTYWVSIFIYRVSLFHQEIASTTRRFWSYVFTKIAWLLLLFVILLFVGTLTRIVTYQYFELYDLFNIGLFSFIIAAVLILFQAFLEKSVYDIIHPQSIQKVTILPRSVFWIITFDVLILIYKSIGAFFMPSILPYIHIYISDSFTFQIQSLFYSVHFLLSFLIYGIATAALAKHRKLGSLVLVLYIVGDFILLGFQLLQIYASLLPAHESYQFLSRYSIWLTILDLLFYFVLIIIFYGKKLSGKSLMAVYTALFIVAIILSGTLDRRYLYASDFGLYLQYVFHFGLMIIEYMIYYALTHQLVASPLIKQKQELIR